MAIDDEALVQGAASGLGLASAAIPGPVGIALGVLGEVLLPVYEAIKGGGQGAQVAAAIKAALVAGADAEMKAELGP